MYSVFYNKTKYKITKNIHKLNKYYFSGHMSSRLQSKEDRILLLDYLVSELMAARMVSVDCPNEKKAGMEIVMVI